MSSEQWRTGLVTVTNASQIVIGTASCDWANQLTTSHRFKVDRDGESTYGIGQVVTATRMILSSNYAGTTGTGLSYILTRSFSVSRGYWRCLQGDFDFAEILSQDTIDKIDTDIQNLSASVNINASNSLLHTSGLVNANATITRHTASIIDLRASVVNIVRNTASITNIRASIDGHDKAIDRHTASIIDLRASVVNIDRNTASIVAHSANIVKANASIALNTASIVAHSANIVKANASIALNTASIIHHTENITRANASISNISISSRSHVAMRASYQLLATNLTGLKTYTNLGCGTPIAFLWASPMVAGQSARFIVGAASRLVTVTGASPLKIISPSWMHSVRYLGVTATYIRTPKGNYAGYSVEIEATHDGLDVIGMGGAWDYDK